MSRGSHGSRCNPAAQPQPADVDHGHLMINAFQLPPTSLAWPSRSQSVATTAKTIICPHSDVAGQATGALLEALSQQFAAHTFIASDRSFSPATFEASINTHRSGRVRRFSPIHF